MLIPTGYIWLLECVQRVAQHRDPDATTQLAETRIAYKAIEPLMAEIARIQNLKQTAEMPPLPPRLAGDRVLESSSNDQSAPGPLLTPEQLELRDNFRAALVHYAPIYKEAQIFLHQSLGDGILPSNLLRPGDGELETIPPPRWWTKAGHDAINVGLWGPSRQKGYVLVREVDLEALLRPSDRSSSAPADDGILSPASDSSVPGGNTVASPDHAPAEAACPMTNGQSSERRPSYSPNALRAWFTLRVASWPQNAPPPIEDNDFKAAQLAFEDHIPRDRFREIRREKTPENWRKSGPRRAH
jgi:hypothetical protein